MKKTLLSVATIASILFSVGAIAATQVMPKPDNSKMNQPMVSGTNLTAEDQSNEKSDVELSRKIRRSLTQDSALSIAAQNVKIITNQGDVVLRGPVKNAKEKMTVEQRASSMLGANSKLTSFLEVKEDVTK